MRVQYVPESGVDGKMRSFAQRLAAVGRMRVTCRINPRNLQFHVELRNVRERRFSAFRGPEGYERGWLNPIVRNVVGCTRRIFRPSLSGSAVCWIAVKSIRTAGSRLDAAQSELEPLHHLAQSHPRDCCKCRLIQRNHTLARLVLARAAVNDALVGIEVVRRADALGHLKPEHYLWCASQHHKLDPTKPAHKWDTAWRALRDAAGLPGLRFHDLRHTVVTRLLEAGEPDHVVESITGHLSRRMLEHYSHIRLAAKKAALDRLHEPRKARK